MIRTRFRITLSVLIFAVSKIVGEVYQQERIRRQTNVFAIESIPVTMSLLEEKEGASHPGIDIRECTSIADFDQCLSLQREVFGFTETEVSPRRHFIVSRRAGGWVLGAFVGGDLVGFVHQLVGLENKKVYGYSHMLAVKPSVQNKGVGAKLKWAQRSRSLEEGITLIRWTWDPMQARNAHFNLNRLGAVVRTYAANFYGTDYGLPPNALESGPKIDSDRLFAEWELNSTRVNSLSGESAQDNEPESSLVATVTIEIPPNWSALIKRDAAAARREQQRVRTEFESEFAKGLVCAGFERHTESPRYLLYEW